MVHTYSLIHDDLPAMDDDDLRRGLPTCHKKFGEALAILAGDALLTMAFQVLAEGYPGAAGASCCRELARSAGAAGMVGGQVDDLAWSDDKVTGGQGDKVTGRQPSAEDLEHLHARKTGALIRASLRLGVLAAFGPQEAVTLSPGHRVTRSSALDRFDAFGRRLGLAFQITDDLLDVEGHAEQAGKRVGKDAARGKLTYPGLLGIAESRARAQRLGQEARDCLAPLRPAAGRLLDLVALVLERDR
jgi:geranylgeranyl diphosphate synthase type II